MKNIIVRENIISKKRYIDYGKDTIIKNSYSNIVLNQPYYNELKFNNIIIDDYKNNLLYKGNIKITYSLNNPVQASFQNNTYEILNEIIKTYLSFYFVNIFKYCENISEYDLYFHKFIMINDLNNILKIYFKHISIKDISNIKLIEENEINKLDNSLGTFIYKHKDLKDEVLSDDYKLLKNKTYSSQNNKDKSLILFKPNDAYIKCKDEEASEYSVKGSILYKIVYLDLYEKCNKEELDNFLSYTFSNLMKNIYINKKCFNNNHFIDPFIYENIIKHNNEEYNLILDSYGIKINLILVENISKDISRESFQKTLKK